MKFLSPLDLIWAIPIIGAIIALYLLKMRRIEFRVPATFLWPPSTSDIRANAPFQRLRFSLLLLLQLLAAALIVIALAGPQHPIKGLGGAATIVVLDDSASMQATDVTPTRLGNAVARVKSLIETLSAGDRMALILAGAKTRIVFPLTGDKSQMLRAVNGIGPSDAPANVGEALRLASALVNGRAHARIIVYSDGVFPKVTDFSPGRADLVYVSLGTSEKNAAITSFNSALTASGALSCFSAIHNYDSAAMSVKTVFSVDNVVLDARQIDVPASSNSYLTFNAPPNGRRADLTISSPGDVLASDDHATTYLKGQGAVRALLVTGGNLFLENALSLDPAIRLEKANDVPDYELASSRVGGRYDLVIFDNVPPMAVKAPAIWSFGMPDTQFGVRESGIDMHPQVVDWSHSDPIMNYSDLSDLNIANAHHITEIPGSGAVTLVQGSDGPLVVSSQSGGHRTLYNSWSLLDSDFPLQVSFPIFVANSVAWLTTGRSRASLESGGLNAETGQTFSVATPDSQVTLLSPDGTKQELSASDGAVIIRSADRAGVYSLTGPQTKTSIAINVTNEAASDVRTRPFIDLSGTSVAAVPSSGFILSDFWRPIVLIVLLILSGEWLLYVRRS